MRRYYHQHVTHSLLLQDPLSNRPPYHRQFPDCTRELEKRTINSNAKTTKELSIGDDHVHGHSHRQMCILQAMHAGEQWNFKASEELCAKCLDSHPETTCVETGKEVRSGAVLSQDNPTIITMPSSIILAKPSGVWHPGVSWHSFHEAIQKPHIEHTNPQAPWPEVCKDTA